MIHPSYVDLMKVMNSGVEFGEEPVVNSRNRRFETCKTDHRRR